MVIDPAGQLAECRAKNGYYYYYYYFFDAPGSIDPRG